MNSRWAAVVTASLLVFACLVITWQVRHYYDVQDFYPSISLSLLRGEHLAEVSDILKRDGLMNQLAESYRRIDLVLPTDARIFMTDMTGPTNYSKLGYYYWATYYLFPREIATSLDHVTRITRDSFVGRTSESDQEILASGFDVRMDNSSVAQTCIPLRNLSLREPVNPDWFDSNFDLAVAFLLPLLTALAGMWLFRFLFPSLSPQMPLLEQLASGLGLGMMAIAALTLGVKLCGFRAQGLVLFVTAAGAIAEIWCGRKVVLTQLRNNYWNLVRDPITATIVIVGLLVFLVLFRIAGLQGLADGDAMRWMLKAKIIHLYTGSEIVQWFSNPRLTYAHLDYPTLVPSLHSATYDSLGHVDEFVTKFWPAWLLLLLLAALASMSRAKDNWRPIMSFALLGLLLLPATQTYVQWEGSTMPMIFFTVIGFVQCAFWLIGRDSARLGLGLTFLFGAAMVKFEGFIFLALVGTWMLLLPSARPSLRPSTGFWRVSAFWFLAALPFICLRVQIPAMNYESGWAGYALHNPGGTLSNWPGIFMMQLARFFVNPDFAHWSVEGGRLHWIGSWDGFSSLYNHTTLGLAWFCLLLTVALWFAVPARRKIIVWSFVMFVAAQAVFSLVFASFVNSSSLAEVIAEYLSDGAVGRYLLPMMLVWFATIMIVFFSDPPSAATAGRSFPALKHGYWLLVVALLIMVFGIFVISKNESALPENPSPIAAAASPLNGSETNPPVNPDLDMKLELAIQLENAGKLVEALEEYRELVRLYPNNPEPLNDLAWSLAANPRLELRNGKEAVEFASKAVELTARQHLSMSAVYMGTLAAAYAQDGQFAKAVEMAEKSRDMALLNHQPEIAATDEQLLKRYLAGKAVGSTIEPWR